MDMRTMARPYAKAVYEIAVADNSFVAWEKLLIFLSQLSELSHIKKTFINPNLSTDQKFLLLESLCQNVLFDKGSIFLRLLLSYRKFVLLPYIKELFKEMMSAYLHEEKIQVISYYPLSEAEKKNIREKMEEKLMKKKVEVEEHIDKTLLGGVILKIRDKVIDGSVRGRLQQLLAHIIS